MTELAYVGVGSNLDGPLGSRADYIERARRELESTPGVNGLRSSSIHETDPVGGPAGQGRYLNAAWEVATSLTPRALLNALLDIERRLGRIRNERWGPRVIDLDLLLHGTLVVDEPGLTLPHPEMHRRPFVLVPLRELRVDLFANSKLDAA